MNCIQIKREMFNFKIFISCSYLGAGVLINPALDRFPKEFQRIPYGWLHKNYTSG